MKKVLSAIQEVFYKRMLFFIGLITLWEVSSYFRLFQANMFPSIFFNQWDKVEGGKEIVVRLFALMKEPSYLAEGYTKTASIIQALVDNIVNGKLLSQTLYSLQLIGEGMLIGLVLSAILTAFAMSSKFGKNFVESLVAFAHPLPGIALLPLTMLWFGLGSGSIVFVIVHSVLWPMILNTSSGFASVPKLYRDFGLNIGLGRVGLISGIYIPASLPSIYTGLKIGWARAWRALISAEMIFGATGQASGLGWFISERRSYFDVPAVFASLVIIVTIGILVEDIIFDQMEKRTIRKWGMSL